MKSHAFESSMLPEFDPNCKHCGGKHRDAIHRAEDKPLTIEERYSLTAPEFREKLNTIAEQSGLPVMSVYALWREYSAECSRRDQSALLWEFQQWYAKELGVVAAQSEGGVS